MNTKTWRVDEEPIHILSGHNDEVTCLAVNSELDVVISGSKVKKRDRRENKHLLPLLC